MTLCLHSFPMRAWRSRSLFLAVILLARSTLMVMYSASAITVETELVETELVETADEQRSLVVATVDGSIITLDAHTGTAKSYFQTGKPLVGASSSEVVPGLDGNLYALTVDDDFEILPMTIEQVVQHPIQTCQHDECGIVTGTKLTYLYGLNPVNGRLEWTQQYGKIEHAQESESAADELIVLQRNEFVVRHISALTGEEVWNVTLGHVSALDFSSSPTTKEMLPGRVEQAEAPSNDDMPRIAFGSDGTTITAMDTNNKVLWKRRLKTVVASVYGAVGNGWVPLTVVGNKDRLEDGGDVVPLLLPASGDQERDTYLEHLWQEIQATSQHLTAGSSDMVIYRPPRMEQTSAEMNRLLKLKEQPVCTGVFVDGECQDILLLESEDDVLSDVNLQGLFLTWNTIFAVSALTVLIIGVALRVFYVSKKRQWMAEQQQKEDSREQETTRPLEEDGSAPMPSPRLSLVKSASLPAMRATATTVDALMLDAVANRERARTITSPTATVTSASTDTDDAIKMARKDSRYREDFREIEPLGRGGFGTVFRCENELDGREYAIKKVEIKVGKDFEERRRRVIREVQALAQLDHKNIVRYYTAWLQIEKVDVEQANGMVDESKPGKCYYSSEFLTKEGWSTSPSQTKSINTRVASYTSSNPLYQSINPLGWNGINVNAELDESFRGKSKDFSFDHSSFDSLKESGCNLKRSVGFALPAIRDNSEEEISDESSGFSDASGSTISSNGGSQSSDNASAASTNHKEEQRISDGASSGTLQEPEGKRHILYIQMELCTKTLGDFLASMEARRGNSPTEGVIDIPLALGLFSQIAQGVKHVHEKGLIHRDLKPSNCFIGDDFVVKVGDFGLSRQAGDMDESTPGVRVGQGDADKTSGLGTRSYASPEQMHGTVYGASTDIFSLGIMLFELCYPMTTGMERSEVFSALRNGEFPKDWHSGVASSFPTVHGLVNGMVSERPADRPCASKVTNRIEALLGEYTVLSLDRERHPGCTFLRVEASADEDSFSKTTRCIQDANVEIRQYSVRGQDSKTIMEFALSCDDKESLRRVSEDLKSISGIQLVRQISDSAPKKF